MRIREISLLCCSAFVFTAVGCRPVPVAERPVSVDGSVDANTGTAMDPKTVVVPKTVVDPKMPADPVPANDKAVIREVPAN